jgi:hypothetical protein
MLLPPPEELFKKSVIENEQARTGATIPFIKFARLCGKETIEKLDPDNKKDGDVPEATPTDILPALIMNDYLINAKQAGKLVYCRMGEKFVTDLEKRKNSNISSLNAPS